VPEEGLRDHTDGFIDAHHHVWDLTRRPQPWLSEAGLGALRRTFTTADLVADVAAGLCGRTLVAPGLIDTEITSGRLPEERKAELVAGAPVGRIGVVNDVADLICYLCRPEYGYGYITGATYDVNGGSHIH
jgi:NAD(P)-dependent dehydrogenase (short-subunit alcohol dehydrogenase family)